MTGSMCRMRNNCACCGGLATSNDVVHSMWGDFDAVAGRWDASSVFSYPVYQQLRDHSHAMEDLVAYKEDSMNATVRGNAQRADSGHGFGQLLRRLGARPQLGRAFSLGRCMPGARRGCGHQRRVVGAGVWPLAVGAGADDQREPVAVYDCGREPRAGLPGQRMCSRRRMCLFRSACSR